MSTFFLAMALYPQVQDKAQAEIRSVVGLDRLPGFEDRENLPYINALVKETLRWHPIVPIIAHRSTASDVCAGYDIPEGSWVIGNVWFVLRLNSPANRYLQRHVVVDACLGQWRTTRMSIPTPLPLDQSAF